jgi:hypothetical protein
MDLDNETIFPPFLLLNAGNSEIRAWSASRKFTFHIWASVARSVIFWKAMPAEFSRKWKFWVLRLI